jgi:two-component system cell cycle response regulator DivK
MAMSTSTYPEANDRTKSPQQQRSSQRKRILVVDDNPLSLTLLHQLLKAHGYEILQTPEGRAAIDLARDQQPDMILMDSHPPATPLLACARRSRERS